MIIRITDQRFLKKNRADKRNFRSYAWFVERIITHARDPLMHISIGKLLTLLLFNKVYLYVFKCHINYCKYRE